MTRKANFRPGHFAEDVQEAIVQIQEELGRAPLEVMVHPETNTEGIARFVVMKGLEIIFVPVNIRNDLRIGFSLEPNQVLFDVCDSNCSLE